jgi:hypothetical protein
MLFELLRRSPELASLPGEGHLITEIFHSSLAAIHGSHVLGPQDVAASEPRVVRWMIDHLTHGRRYLDKTPRNSLRVPYLQALFPDAWFVFLRRDGRAAVSSLITGWRSGSDMFPGLELARPLDIEGYRGTRWKFVIPEGWQAYAGGRTLAQVCAFQWTECTDALLAAEAASDRGRWVDVRYEDLVEHPQEELRRLLARLALSPAPEVLDAAGALDRHVTKAVTPPEPDKWRRENPEEIATIVDVIAPTMRRLGYSLDGAQSGVER